MAFEETNCEIEADLTFVERTDNRPPWYMFSGYRNSHMHLDSLAPSDCLIDIHLNDWGKLYPGERGSIWGHVLGPANLNEHLRVGADFSLTDDDRLIATGTITAILKYERLAQSEPVTSADY